MFCGRRDFPHLSNCIRDWGDKEWTFIFWWTVSLTNGFLLLKWQPSSWSLLRRSFFFFTIKTSELLWCWSGIKKWHTHKVSGCGCEDWHSVSAASLLTDRIAEAYLISQQISFLLHSRAKETFYFQIIRSTSQAETNEYNEKVNRRVMWHNCETGKYIEFCFYSIESICCVCWHSSTTTSS